MSTSLGSAERAEAIVAGTLCLMSCFARAPGRYHADRIAQNLALLAEDAGVTPELRTVCRRLGDRWEAIAYELSVDDAGRSQPSSMLRQ
jgi:hypothetical protein